MSKVRKSVLKLIEKHLILYCIGGVVYVLIELLDHASSHWSMFIVGGLAFIICGLINEVLKWTTPLWIQALIGGGIITILELIAGVFVNLILKWDVWDYSMYRFNLFGQICYPYSFIWCLLAVVAIIIDDYLRFWLFDEEKPRYILFHFRGKQIRIQKPFIFVKLTSRFNFNIKNGVNQIKKIVKNTKGYKHKIL